MVLSLVALVGGVGLLAVAADQFVLGAARVALLRRIPPLVVGVVIIGFGTSSPELLVSALAAARDEPEVAVGNIVGSNLANLSLLLGIGAVLIPLHVSSRTVLREAPLTLAAMAAFTLVIQGNALGLSEGIALLACMVAVGFAITRRSGADPIGHETEELADAATHRLASEIVRTVLGLVGTIAGAQLLLWAALDLADRAGLSDGFVGATVVAVGTSLPELVTVIQSARRREPDLIVGNLLGSNLFNSLAVGGVIGLIGVSALNAPELTTVAAVAALASAAAAWIMMRTDHVVNRREGTVLIIGYLAVLPLLS